MNRIGKNDVDDSSIPANRERTDSFSNDAGNDVTGSFSDINDDSLESNSSIAAKSSDANENKDIKPEFGSQNTNNSFCLSLSIESLDGCKRFESEPTGNLEAIIYRQISAQISKMLEAALCFNEVEEEMDYEIEGTVHTIKNVEIKSDGNCLFRALAHQLFCDKSNSRKQDISAKKMRADAVAFIKANYEQFEHELKGCVFERKNQIEIGDIEEECKIYLNHILPKNGCWGGAETIKAVSSLHAVNVLIFNEYGRFYYVNGFNADYVRTIIIAYRLGVGSIRNHYDSGA